MSSIGTSVAQAVAGVQQTARAATVERDRERGAPAGRPRRDTVELDVEAVDEADAERDLKGNEQEEAQQDHVAHDSGAAERPRIDVEG